MRLFIQDYEEIGEQKPRQSEEQDCNRLLEEAEAEKHDKAADIHGIAHVLVRTGDHELARGIEWRWSALAAGDESRYAGDGENSAGGHDGDTENTGPAGQGEAESVVVAAVQA